MTEYILADLMDIPVVKRVGDLFLKAGFDIYLVGGCVRDSLLDQAPDDLDFTTNARPNEIEKVLDAFTQWDAGKEFGTIAALVNGRKVEITTFRADRYRPGDRHPEVTFGDCLDDDLVRRDFTINAMAVDLRDGFLIDLYEGHDDLRCRVLRTPMLATISMTDDPLRVLRAVRFASVRGFEICEELRSAMEATSLDSISQERKTAELEKILAAGPDAAAAADRICSPRLRRELFGHLGACMDPEELIGFKAADARSLFAFIGSYADDLEELAEYFGAMRLSNELHRHCRNVFQIVHDYWYDRCDVKQVVRDHSDEVLADCTAILHSRFEVEEHFLLGYRSNLRVPLPIDGNDCIALGFEGPAIGDALRRVELAVLDNCYLSKQDALALLS